jgi:hypothetical protein
MMLWAETRKSRRLSEISDKTLTKTQFDEAKYLRVGLDAVGEDEEEAADTAF